MYLLSRSALLAACCLGVLAVSNSHDSHVTELAVETWESTIGTDIWEKNSFVDFISGSHETYVYFYTPYSGHCKLTTPLYEEAATFLKEHAAQAEFAKMNCVDSSPFCRDLAIDSYPRLQHYYAGHGLYDEFIGSKDIAEKIDELTAGLVTLKKDTLPKKPVADSIAPRPTLNALPDDIYLTEDGLSAFVKLDVPDVPARHSDHNSSILLNFTISANRHHLLLNNELFALLVPEPSVPPRLRAKQIFSNADLVTIGRETSPRDCFAGKELGQTLALDYDFTMSNRDDPSIRYYNYHPVLQVNIIGARYLQGGSDPRETGDLQPHYILDGVRGTQKIVEVRMREQNRVSSNSPNRNFTISSVKFLDRPKDYKAPHAAKSCTWASWRCADISDPPWYSEVWYDQFDEHGRIGCLRRAVSMWWNSSRPIVLYLLCPSWCILVVWKAWRSLSRSRAIQSRENVRKEGILT